MKTQPAFEYGYGIDVRAIPQVALVLGKMFLNLTDEERVTYSALFLCSKMDPEIIRYDYDLCALCVGPLIMDKHMNDAQCSRLYLAIISSKETHFNALRENIYHQFNSNVSVDQIRKNMLTAAKDTLESNCVEGFC